MVNVVLFDLVACRSCLVWYDCLVFGVVVCGLSIVRFEVVYIVLGCAVISLRGLFGVWRVDCVGLVYSLSFVLWYAGWQVGCGCGCSVLC